MIGYAAQRVWQAVFVLLAVTVIAFVMLKYLGDPLVAILGSDSTAEQRARVRSELGLDRPLIVQYGSFLGRAAIGDFGVSFRLGRPVDAVLLERIPATVELAVVGMALALLIGIPAGIYTAIHRRNSASRLLLGASLLGISLPSSGSAGSASPSSGRCAPTRCAPLPSMCFPWSRSTARTRCWPHGRGRRHGSKAASS